MFSLESPRRGDSNESVHIKYLIIIKKRKSPDIIPNTIMSAAMGFLLGTQERVQHKRAISVRATEVLQYF